MATSTPDWVWYIVAYAMYAVVEGVLTARKYYRSNPNSFHYSTLSKLFPYIVWAPLHTLERIFDCLDCITNALDKAARLILTFGNDPKK